MASDAVRLTSLEAVTGQHAILHAEAVALHAEHREAIADVDRSTRELVAGLSGQFGTLIKILQDQLGSAEQAAARQAEAEAAAARESTKRRRECEERVLRLGEKALSPPTLALLVVLAALVIGGPPVAIVVAQAYLPQPPGSGNVQINSNNAESLP